MLSDTKNLPFHHGGKITFKDYFKKRIIKPPQITLSTVESELQVPLYIPVDRMSSFFLSLLFFKQFHAKIHISCESRLSIQFKVVLYSSMNITSLVVSFSINCEILAKYVIDLQFLCFFLKKKIWKHLQNSNLDEI